MHRRYVNKLQYDMSSIVFFVYTLLMLMVQGYAKGCLIDFGNNSENFNDEDWNG